MGLLAAFGPIWILTAAGYLARRLRLFSGEAALALSQFVFHLAIPADLFLTLARTPLSGYQAAPIGAFAVSTVLIVGAGWFAAWRFFGRKPGERAIWGMAAGYVNSANLGIPIAMQVLGNVSFIIEVLLLQTLVVTPIILIVLDRHDDAAGGGTFRRLLTLPVRNPVILASALGVTASATSFHAPQLIASTLTRHVIFDPNGSFDPSEPTKWPGTLEHKGIEYEAVWPGLVSQAEYSLMKAQLDERAQAWAHGLQYGRRYLLTGFICCAVCGGVVIGSRRRLANGTYVRRYRWKKYDNHGTVVGCGHVYLLADPLEAYVTEQVLARLDTPEVRRALSQEDRHGDAGEATAKLVAVRQRRQEILDNFGHGEVTPAGFQRLLAASDEAIALAQAQLPKASETQAVILRGVDQVRDRWEPASLDWRRNVSRLLVERVELLAGGHSGTALWNG